MQEEKKMIRVHDREILFIRSNKKRLHGAWTQLKKEFNLTEKQLREEIFEVKESRREDIFKSLRLKMKAAKLEYQP